jgi:hypothetical protein
MAEPKFFPVVDPDFGKRVVSREPDALLDEKLFGHEVQWALWGSRQLPFRKGWQDYGMPYSVPHYHEKIQDAWLVVEELAKRGIRMEIPMCEARQASKVICQESMRLLNITE